MKCFVHKQWYKDVRSGSQTLPINEYKQINSVCYFNLMYASSMRKVLKTFLVDELGKWEW